MTDLATIIDSGGSAPSAQDAGGGGGGESGGEPNAPSPQEAAAIEREELRKIASDTITGKKPVAPPNGKAAAPVAPKVSDVLAKKPATANEPPVAEPTTSDTDPRELQRALKRREAENVAREELRRGQAELTAARAQIQADADASKKARAEAEGLLEMLRKDPLGAVQKAGWDPDEFVMNAARRNDPGALAQREALAQKQRLEALEKWKSDREESEKSAVAARKKADEDAQRDHESKSAEAAKAGFLKTALDAEKYPTLAKQYGKRPHLLVVEAERVADEYYRKTKAQTGKGEFASWQDIAEYLESDHSDSTELTTPQTGQRQAHQAERAPGKRTLTTDQGSERRSGADPDALPTRNELVSISKRIIGGART